jgi:AraC-like DNA-binding protein
MLGLLWRVAETYGVDPAQVVPASLYRPGGQIGERSYSRIKDYYEIQGRILGLIDDDAVGLKTGMLIQPSHLGVFGHAWLASPSLIASYRMLERFGRVFFRDLRVRLTDTPDAIEIFFDTHSVSPYPDIDADTHTVGLVHFSRMQYGESFVPMSVSLNRAEPAQRSSWDDYFRAPVEFGAPEVVVRIDPAIAKEILTTAHSALFDQHQDSLAEARIELEESDIVARVRYAIQQLLPAGTVNEQRVARVVNVNPRTLHRRLSEAGMTFRSLLRDVRMSLAQRHLDEDRYNVTEVAFMLGYSDSSAFSRAFKGWFGVTPSAFREVGIEGQGLDQGRATANATK